MKTFKLAGAQGEVNFRKIDALPVAGLTPLAPEGGRYIVGHSESGHHHYLPEVEGVTVLERTEGLPEGMKMFYAMLEKPLTLAQDAASPHEALEIPAGMFRISISREYDPFADQVRQVAD